MSLTARIETIAGRPMLVLNGEPTAEFWCYGYPNAIDDFAAADNRICQWHCPSWWVGPGKYDFTEVDAKFDEFLAKQPGVLLIPRLAFGYEKTGWWGALHPNELSVGRDLAGQAVDYTKVRAHEIWCWHSAGSEQWTRDASTAAADFVKHCEERYGQHVIGYQIGGCISTEWFRWWTYIEETYEDYSPAAQTAFRKYLAQRYRDDAGLQAAWGRGDVTLATAAVPAPPRMHKPALGFFRDPRTERDVVDWLECLSTLNVGQLVALCGAAKRACGGQKLVGVFYGYLFPHWNNQSAARQGHLGLDTVLRCPDVDYVSSPYHYDNRGRDGFHHSQTVPEAIARAGKLHLDEIDTATHLADPKTWPRSLMGSLKTAADSNLVLTRDAAAIMGTAGIGWWMDLCYTRWFGDPGIQTGLRDLQELARQTRDWPVTSPADVALVVDDASSAWCDLRSDQNLYFTSMPRHFEWSDLGFPLDTLLLREVPHVRPYKLYVFLNCWHVPAALRAGILPRLRHSGGSAVWFYGSGFYDGLRHGADATSDLVGMRVHAHSDTAVPLIRVRDLGHPLIEQSLVLPRGALDFGARLSKEREGHLVNHNPRDWNTPISPLFEVTDPAAVVLGDYQHDGSPGLAVMERDGWSSVYCGAPMLPGWLLHRIAATAGAHIYAPPGTQIYHRGPLLAAFRPHGGQITLTAPVGQRLTPITPRGPQRRWRPDPGVVPAPELLLKFAPGQTRFFMTDR